MCFVRYLIYGASIYNIQVPIMAYCTNYITKLVIFLQFGNNKRKKNKKIFTFKKNYKSRAREIPIITIRL